MNRCVIARILTQKLKGRERESRVPRRRSGRARFASLGQVRHLSLRGVAQGGARFASRGQVRHLSLRGASPGGVAWEYTIQFRF
jgi:hypothetical protein